VGLRDAAAGHLAISRTRVCAPHKRFAGGGARATRGQLVPALCCRLAAMIRQIAPVFFTLDIPRTLAYYEAKLGFKCLGTWQDPPVYAIVARDERAIHFRCAEPPKANPDKYSDELLDAYLFVEDADALYAEYGARGVEFVRGLANMPWNSREFVVKDCDGRLLAFGANL
jgi:uncharacterized glyoxalase superfamily protein PhnB